MDNILSLVLDVHTLFCEISLPYIKLVFGCFREFPDALMVTTHAQQFSEACFLPVHRYMCCRHYYTKSKMQPTNSVPRYVNKRVCNRSN